MKAIEMRAALVTSFHAVGRGGEAGLLTWGALSWDYDEENLSRTWAQQKVLNVLDINFLPMQMTTTSTSIIVKRATA